MVRKIFPYDPTLGGKFDKFEGYKRIILRKADPGVNKVLRIDVHNEVDKIFSSTLLRAKETVENYIYTNCVQPTYLHHLDEILFDLGHLATKDEYDLFGSSLVRERFIDAFIKDELLEKRKEIKTRILELINLLGNGNYLIISHSFFMKLLQTYLVENTLFENPEILKKHFDFEQKTFGFGEGFDFSL